LAKNLKPASPKLSAQAAESPTSLPVLTPQSLVLHMMSEPCDVVDLCNQPPALSPLSPSSVYQSNNCQSNAFINHPIRQPFPAHRSSRNRPLPSVLHTQSFSSDRNVSPLGRQLGSALDDKNNGSFSDSRDALPLHSNLYTRTASLPLRAASPMKNSFSPLPLSQAVSSNNVRNSPVDPENLESNFAKQRSDRLFQQLSLRMGTRVGGNISPPLQ
jgi:hypothetical protein